MSNNDLIRRGDALALPHRLSSSCDAHDGYFISADAIRALPAVSVGVKPLEWVENPDASEGGMLGGGVTNSVYYATSDGWSFHRNMFWRKADTLEAAKAAAQADYDARILAALTPAPAVDVKGLVEAAKEMFSAFYSDGNVTERHLRACNAGVKLNAALAALEKEEGK